MRFIVKAMMEMRQIILLVGREKIIGASRARSDGVLRRAMKTKAGERVVGGVIVERLGGMKHFQNFRSGSCFGKYCYLSN